jgi:UDP-N-acetylmuramoylalanine--D-glutamate ligase
MSLHGPWSERPWRRALVYGLGASGLAAARLLRRHGVEVVGVDRRPITPGVALEPAPDFAFLPEASAAAIDWSGLDGVVLSPGVPVRAPLVTAARAHGLPVIAEVELAFPFLSGPVVAITGSNGKSTTTAMTGALLRAAGMAVEVCGNIGVPLCDTVEGPAGRVFVVELSSYQLETTDRFHPRAAAYLNLSPDHLDRHGDLAAYGAAKQRIFLRQAGGDVSVVNADDPWTRAAATAARRRSFSRRGPVEDGCYLDAGGVVERRPGAATRELFAAGDVPVPGPHNVENAMAAALLAVAIGAPVAAIRAGLRTFRGLPHRLAKVRTLDGVDFYDDSKGTNLDATAKSLEGFADGTVHLILGGRGKGTDFRELGEIVARKARRLYLIGETAAEIEAALGALVPAIRSGTLERAIADAAEAAGRGETVLLSPACASFDQFRDFNHRGDEFERLVGLLPGGGR